MKEFARKERADNRIVGLIPTMGALHAGHLSLLQRAKLECSSVVASIFVNPKQFSPTEDFGKYPRALQADLEKLHGAGVAAVFMPEAAEMYPHGFNTYVTVEGLSERLEGRSRPGHFRGVSTVVLKLLEIIQPDFAYFGRKDAQQVQIISRMARDLNLHPQIVVCPIVREADGLAMSSRNVYLSVEERKSATILHRALEVARQMLLSGERDAQRLQTAIRGELQKEKTARVDYAQIVDAENFEPVARVAGRCYALLAVYIGKTRLLDNLWIDVTNTETGVIAEF